MRDLSNCFAVCVSTWLVLACVCIVALPAAAIGSAPGDAARVASAAPSRRAQTVSWTQRIEDRIQRRTVGGVTALMYLGRRLSRTVRFAVQKWWRWLGRASVFFVIGVAASLFDRRLWSRWRVQPWHVLTAYVPLAVVVYLRVLFDRRADRVGQVALMAALAYAVVPWDLVPDHLLVIGALDDALIVAVASRWFLRRCPAGLIERQARFVEMWRERTAKIQASRRRLRRRRDRESIGDVDA